MRKIKTMTEAKGQPLSGLLLTLTSANQKFLSDIVAGSYREWAPSIIAQAMRYVVKPDSDMPFVTPHEQMWYQNIFYLTEKK